MKERIKNLELKIKMWIKENPREAIFLSIIILVGAFLRLYRISEYMIFLGDEGRDAIIVRRLLVNFDPILIGPRTSIGDMYLGPLYYYLIAIPLLLANFSPVGPSVFVALLGVVTIFFIWYVTREWFGWLAGGLSALLYAISPVVITYSKSSWNPNVMPFFALLSIYSVWKLLMGRNYKWLIVTFLSMSFVLQSHYLGLLLVPTLGLIWFLKLINIINLKASAPSSLEIKKFAKYSILGFGLFMTLMSPLVIFDARHGWNNFKSVRTFFLERQTTVSARPWTGIPKLPEIAYQINLSLLGAKNADITWIFTYIFYPLFAVIFIYGLFRKIKFKILEKSYLYNLLNRSISPSLSPYLIISVWILISFLGLSLYKQHIYDHYFGFFFPAPFILVGAVSQYVISNSKRFWQLTLLLFLIYVVYVNLLNTPIRYSPNRQMQRAEEVAGKIRVEADDQKLNLAVIAERNYEDGYQYFLERWNEPVYDIDPLNLEQTLAQQLFVVCEMSKDKCDPTHSPKSEIANFGWSKIHGEWDVSGVTVYKLVHAQ